MSAGVQLRSVREPLDVVRDRRDWKRWLAEEQSSEFGAVFTDQSTGEVHSYAAWAPVALEAQEQLELELPACSLRHEIRRALAEKIERDVLPLCNGQWLHRYARLLRAARWSGAVGYAPLKGKNVVFWDQKAGLSRLCPDDAREEAMRLHRRVLNPLEALQADGHALHYCVFTTPNVGPGGLRAEMISICKRFRGIFKAKNKDGELRFPQVKGALCVLEAPLGWARDWNVHLNVILVVKGYLSWEELRAWWYFDVSMRQLAQGPGVVKGALCELIKYAVAATAAKSATHQAKEDRPPPPPMLEWTGSELLEWLRAMRGFRRTRTYGCLFRLKRPEPEDLGQIIWLGRIDHDGTSYKLSSRLLNSIPEDKSTGLSAIERWQTLMRELKPHLVEGAGRLGEGISRDVRHRLSKLSEIL